MGLLVKGVNSKFMNTIQEENLRTCLGGQILEKCP